jgi:hypothetical protein
VASARRRQRPPCSRALFALVTATLCVCVCVCARAPPSDYRNCREVRSVSATVHTRHCRPVVRTTMHCDPLDHIDGCRHRAVYTYMLCSHESFITLTHNRICAMSGAPIEHAKCNGVRRSRCDSVTLTCSSVAYASTCTLFSTYVCTQIHTHVNCRTSRASVAFTIRCVKPSLSDGLNGEGCSARVGAGAMYAWSTYLRRIHCSFTSLHQCSYRCAHVSALTDS